MNRIFVVGGALGFIIIVILGIYFFAVRNESDDLITQKNKLEEALGIAQAKLSSAKDVLGRMTDDLSNYFFFGLGIQDQIKDISEIVKQTDFLFINANGQNPEFLVENFSTGDLINEERRKINIILADWQEKTSILSLSKIGLKEAQQIQEEAERIQDYLASLYGAVGGLTPENSGLSQAKIDSYLFQLPATESVSEIITSLATSITTQSSQNNSQTSTQTNQNITTPEQVSTQQDLIREYEEQIQTIEQNIVQVEQQIQNTNPPSPESNSPAVVVETPIVPTPVVNPNTSPVPVYGTYGSRVIVPTTGIIIQPGPVRLIQGSDEF